MFIKLPFLTLYYIGQAKGRSPDKDRGSLPSSLPSCVVASMRCPTLSTTMARDMVRSNQKELEAERSKDFWRRLFGG
jgi:hypothetical protein